MWVSKLCIELQSKKRVSTKIVTCQKKTRNKTKFEGTHHKIMSMHVVIICLYQMFYKRGCELTMIMI